jgi:hypothetical protein
VKIAALPKGDGVESLQAIRLKGRCRMKRLILALALPLMLVLLGCDGVSPTAPEVEIQADAVSATPTTTVGATWTGSANAGVHEVPISGSETTLADPSVLVDCLLPDGSVATQFPAVIHGTGRFTHLGKTTSVITTNSCLVNLSNGGLDFLGEADHVAANGDVLHALFGGTALTDGTLDFEFVTFSGGTGRFENATGSADAQGFSNAADGTGEFSFEGMISSVGSSK